MIEFEAPTFPTIPVAANDNGWLIVRTNPRCERRVIFGLKDLGILAYLPCEVRWKTTRSTKVRIKLPLFPGYLFVGLRTDHTGAHERLYEVRCTDGVAGVVMGTRGVPAVVSGGEVSALMGHEADGDFDRTPAEKSAFKVGQAVRIVRGKFQGVVATVVAAADNDAVRISSTGIFAGTWTEDAEHIEAA